MSSAKKDVLENPPRAPKLKSLAAIYAAEDARKAACNSPWKFPKKSSSTASDTESEPSNFEEISSLYALEENDLNTGRLDAFDIPLKDLRARCKYSKKRKADSQPKEADDLDEPLIVLKARRSESHYVMRSKSTEKQVISGCFNVCSKGLVVEDSPGIQETLTMQTDYSVTSSFNDVSSLHQDWELLLEVEPIDIVPSKVDFIAKFDSCNLSSNLIWQTVENRQSWENLMFSLNKQCVEIVDSEVGTNPVCLTENASDSKRITCSFNQACIDSQFEEDLCLLENNQGSLDLDQITEVDTDINPATMIRKLPTKENLCSFKVACPNDADFGENLYSSENSHNSPLQSELMEVKDNPTSIAITENIQGGQDLLSFCDEARPCDVKSGGDLYSPGGSQDTLHGSEFTEAQIDVASATEISPGGENIRSSSKEECNSNRRNVENIYTPDNCLNILEGSEDAHVEANKNPFMVTDTAAVDAVANIHTGNGSRDDYEFNSGVPDLLDATNLRSSEGHLESIVYSAISTSKCLHNKEVETSSSVHRVLASPTENAETDSNYGHGAATNFDEVFERSYQVQSTEKTKKEISRVLQLGDCLEKQQCRITNDGANLEREAEGDHITTRMHAPIKLMSNRTIISPTSQEKLCQAITEIDLCEGAKIPKSKKSILFKNYTGMKKCAITTQNTENVPQKTNGMIRKGNLKSIGAVCTKDPSAKMDTEKAIEFSRRQMHDFENVTSKLLKNMRFMRSLLDESLAVQSPWISKYSTEEIKAASQNASELERTTKKWLGIMSKDCNRFCKILKSASNSASPPPTSNSGVTNRRKIVFADEAGGILCDIRVFSEASSPPTAENESADQ